MACGVDSSSSNNNNNSSSNNNNSHRKKSRSGLQPVQCKLDLVDGAKFVHLNAWLCLASGHLSPKIWAWHLLHHLTGLDRKTNQRRNGVEMYLLRR
jgi:hypothetical protein